jgi:hypothetical protein
MRGGYRALAGRGTEALSISCITYRNTSRPGTSYIASALTPGNPPPQSASGQNSSR